jgi:hypothetical protein
MSLQFLVASISTCRKAAHAWCLLLAVLHKLDPMHYGVLNATSVRHGTLTLPALTPSFVAHTGHEKHQLPK